MKYPSPDQTYVPNPAADPRLMISYPGWMIGVVPDYAGAADDLAAGKRLPTVFTVDGETFHDSPDGLMVVKGVDSTARIREIVAKINDRDEYKDCVIFIFGITYNSDGEAVDMAVRHQDAITFSPDDPVGMAKIDRIERFSGNTNGYKQITTLTMVSGDSWARNAVMTTELAAKLMSKEAVEARGYLALPHGPCRIRAVAGRNDPCPCGSGRKFKKCCMRK